MEKPADDRPKATDPWQPIDTAPDDFDRPGGARTLLLRDRDYREFRGARSYFNNSGWAERGTNKEIWPVEWRPAS